MSQGAVIVGSVSAGVGLSTVICVVGCYAGYAKEKEAAKQVNASEDTSSHRVALFCGDPLPLCCDQEVALYCCPLTLAWLVGRGLYKVGERLGERVYHACFQTSISPIREYLLVDLKEKISYGTSIQDNETLNRFQR